MPVASVVQEEAEAEMTSVDVDLYEFDPEKMPDPKTILVLLNSRKNNLSLRAY